MEEEEQEGEEEEMEHGDNGLFPDKGVGKRWRKRRRTTMWGCRSRPKTWTTPR